MKIYKLLALAAVPVLALTACTDEVKYTEPAPAGTPATYFSYENVTKYDLNEGQNNFTVNIYRAGSQGEATVKLLATAYNTGSEENGPQNTEVTFFNVPSEVTFADGSNVAPLTITFPFEELTPYDRYQVTVKIEGSYSTDYVLGQDTFTLFYIPWQPVEGGDGSSMCEFLDIITTWLIDFGEPVPADERTWEVPIQVHPKFPGYYRLAEPYSPKYNLWAQVGLEGYCNYVELPDDEVRYMYVHAEDPEYVYFDAWWTGWDPYTAWGYGQAYWLTYVAYYLQNGNTLEAVKANKPEMFGTDDKGYITMPAGSCLITFETMLPKIYVMGDEGLDLLLPGAERVVEPLEEVDVVKPEGDWKYLGTGNYDDGLLAPAFGAEGEANYPVEVYVDADNSSRFLVENAYNNEFWAAAVGFPEQTYYLEFDCTVPGAVLVPKTFTGVYGDRQPVYVSNVQAVLHYGMDVPMDEILGEDYEDYTTSFADGVITIGAESAAFSLEDDYDTFSTYEEGCPTVLELPTAAKAHLMNKCEGNAAKIAARFDAQRRFIRASILNANQPLPRQHKEAKTVKFVR